MVSYIHIAKYDLIHQSRDGYLNSVASDLPLLQYRRK